MIVPEIGPAFCALCGINLDDLRARGYAGHACSSRTPVESPSTKVRLQDVPPALAIAAAIALAEDEHVGRAPYDWRGTKTSVMRHVGGMLRHLFAYLDGEDVDPDSPTGKLHLDGVAGRLAILLDAVYSGDVTDDRPQPGSAGSRIRIREAVNRIPIGIAPGLREREHVSPSTRAERDLAYRKARDSAEIAEIDRRFSGTLAEEPTHDFLDAQKPDLVREPDPGHAPGCDVRTGPSRSCSCGYCAVKAKRETSL